MNLTDRFLSYFLLFLATPLLAATYYVSPTGSDSNSGTSTNSPWLWQASHTLQPGDTVYFLGGTYTNDLGFDGMGLTNMPITYQAYPGEEPVVSIPNYSSDGIDIGGNNQILIGFAVNGAYDGIRVSGGDGATNDIVEDCDISGCWVGGIIAQYGNINGVIIRNCRVYNSSLENWPRGSAGWGGAITIAESNGTNCLIENCLVYFCNGEGIGIENANNCTVRNCIIADTCHTSMYSDGDNDIWSNNVTYCTAASLFLNGGSSFGVQPSFTQEYQDISWITNAIGLRGSVMVNNLFVNTVSGFYIDDYQNPYTNYPFSDILFANNTCIGCANAAISISSQPGYITSPYNNFHIINNLFLSGPLNASPYFWVLRLPTYPIDLGNNIYCYETCGQAYDNTNSVYVDGAAAVTNWMLLSGETNAGSRASLWLFNTNQANFLISNVLQSAASMPVLWQTNGGPPPTINVNLLFTNLLACSNNIDTLRRQLAAPFSPINNSTNPAVTMGRSLSSWAWVDDFGATNTIIGPIGADLLGHPRVGIPTIGALNPMNLLLPPSSLEVLQPGQ
jgi:hypothetical protein